MSRWDKKRAAWENYHQGDTIREIALDGDYVWFRGAVSVDRVNLKDGVAWLGKRDGVGYGEKIGLFMPYSLVV